MQGSINFVILLSSCCCVNNYFTKISATRPMNNITIMTTNTGCDIDVDVHGYRLQPKYMNKSTSELSYPLHHCLPDVTTAIFSEKAINCIVPN